MAIDSIPHRARQHAALLGDQPAYHVRTEAGWQATSWRDFGAEISRAARALVALGLEAGGRVAMLGGNRPEWVIFHHGAMAAGGAGAGIYATLTPAEAAYVLRHAGARVFLVETAEAWQGVAALGEELPDLVRVVTMRGAGPVADPRVLTWEDFEALATEVPERAIEERIEALRDDDLASLIYTSGTTGRPKGVMLSHRNLLWTASALAAIVESKPGDCVLSYLPLSHIAEQMATLHIPAAVGTTVYFAQTLEKLPEHLREVQPHLFFGVPRVWEKFQAALAARLGQARGLKGRLLAWARRVATQVNHLRNRGVALPPGLALSYWLAGRLVFGKLKAALGFSRARALVTGAAPLAREVMEFFASLDLPIHEVYGQSEGSGPTSYNFPGRTRFGSVGRPLAGVEVRLAEDGEILVRGPNVFLGYFRDPEATSETLADGWLCSGDLGVFDADGFLHITGRKKEILITAGGKNLAPLAIEAAIKESPLVADAVLIGDRRKFVSALITLDGAAASRLVAEQGESGPPHESPRVRAAIEAAVEQVNRRLARFEQVKKFTLLPASFSIEGGELTPTMKVKRRVVAEKYAAEIEAMYAEP
ncbi:MAG TPA: long-chain fatty acid--CoA ligase [Thermoanaerobaculia bacterium]|nr:long-chain fatty acid--CoA ligase [Thermoanaerobaculia bacterium]